MKNRKLVVTTVVLVAIAALLAGGAIVNAMTQRSITPDANLVEDMEQEMKRLEKDLEILLSAADGGAPGEIFTSDDFYNEMCEEEWEETVRGYEEYQERVENDDIVEYTDDTDYSDPDTPVWGE
jgi:hypothetical protein